jgi:hypothetical protein
MSNQLEKASSIFSTVFSNTSIILFDCDGTSTVVGSSIFSMRA